MKKQGYKPGFQKQDAGKGRPDGRKFEKNGNASFTKKYEKSALGRGADSIKPWHKSKADEGEFRQRPVVHNHNVSSRIFTGSEITLKIDSIAYGGDGVAEFEGSTVYVPYALPGSTVIARVLEARNIIVQAQLIKTLSESPHYTQPACSYFGRCGGCDFMNMPYQTQADFKGKIVRDLMEKAAGLKNVPMKPMVSYDSPLNYRNRAEYRPVLSGTKFMLGFYKARSHDVIGVDSCMLLHPKINALAKVITEAINENMHAVSIYNIEKGKGYIRHVTIRVNREGSALITFVVNGKEPKQFILRAVEKLQQQPGMAGIILNYNMEKESSVFGPKEKVMFGRPSILEKAAGVSFKLGNRAFFQVNAGMMEKMAEFVKSRLPHGATVLDLYGGVGALTLPSASGLREITVVESDTEAAQNLRDMIRWNKISNVHIVNGRAEDVIEDILDNKRFDAAVIDPPRSGMHPRLVHALKNRPIEKIVYISCNPSSFARDIAELKGVYHVDEITPLDQFAQTYHIELMAELSHVKAYEKKENKSRERRQ